MLDWMKGEGADAGMFTTLQTKAPLTMNAGEDTSKVLEPPETPAPVFALRAFKSAIFGTPGAEDDEKTPRPAKPRQEPHQRSKSEPFKPEPIEAPELKPDSDDATGNLSGTISNRRKTVSFGEGVVDNEGKRESPSKSRTPQPSGSLSVQWMSGSADGKRSKLTQSLIDARENTSTKPTLTTPPDPSPNPSSATRSEDEAGAEDITLNLDEPRSESGKYWKTEFDNYRMRTNREIKKLVHYRSVSKSYARKKDDEALRLMQKLKEEEERVAEMERQVTHLAASVLGEDSKSDKEQLIKDLTKQTALALQYKQQVTSLRATLEKQGVFEGSGSSGADSKERKDETSLAQTPDELRNIQQELKQANSKLEELEQKNPDLSKLQNLAQSSEKKAQELEKENTSLKLTLARVKQEMSQYEGRRKEKEARLKQREIKLEARVQEYRARLKATNQEHRQSEEALRKEFEAERRRMQSQIDQLKTRVIAVEQGPILRPQQRTSLSPRKAYTGIQIHDFAEDPTVDIETTDDMDAPPSPSPRSKGRDLRQYRNATTGALDMKRTSREIAADDDEVTHYLNEILPRSATHRDKDIIPPSSPPNISVSPMKALNPGYPRHANRDDEIDVLRYRPIHRDTDASTARRIRTALAPTSSPHWTRSQARAGIPSRGIDRVKLELASLI
ncbi:hypothetical protein N7468_008105 [Penicillium chermesinum]|uniref:Spindle pole body-associated protein cut12 domain-containing protein n=1 Tax=Penicillium chermesinum TaxID=63820 RepID=A0A9W9TI52_9EURO|nr:uncharacterized protein N7468_008105 [Penicillium chermesinum]KAJ5223563.1 hypothetical protein N7468_008105 [Penicillium chermesinum]